MSLEKPCKDNWRAKNRDGYHRTNPNSHAGFNLYHRYLYAKYHKLVTIEPGLEVRHLCNNSWCVEITHLALGTAQENANDRVRAGNAISKTKITDEQVYEIRRLYKTTALTQKDLAKMFNLSDQHISDLINYKRRRRTKPYPPA